MVASKARSFWVIPAFLLRTSATALLLAASASLNAAPLWCIGTLSNLFIRTGGEVNVVPSWRGDYVAVCNVNQTLSYFRIDS
jgi:hypothetical protein